MLKLTLRSLLTILVPLVPVWAVWLWSQGYEQAFQGIADYWEISLTMVFGSLVAGATSLGGGAVAFPIFTKVLDISAYDAKVFSLAIQSVGMGAASIIIYLNRYRVDWRIIRWGSIGGVAGVWVGLGFLSQVLPGNIVKMFFTLMLATFAVTLFIMNSKTRAKHELAPQWSGREKAIILSAGMLGGMMSGIVGNGIDVFIFVVMVLLFRMSEKTATPTSVILMGINAITGFVMLNWIFGDFNETVKNYWLAAVPIVVIGAPVGAIVCSYLKRETIAHILITLIVLELFSTLLLIPITADVVYASAIFLIFFSYLNYRMYKNRYYQSEPDFI